MLYILSRGALGGETSKCSTDIQSKVANSCDYPAYHSSIIIMIGPGFELELDEVELDDEDELLELELELELELDDELEEDELELDELLESPIVTL